MKRPTGFALMTLSAAAALYLGCHSDLPTSDKEAPPQPAAGSMKVMTTTTTTSTSTTESGGRCYNVGYCKDHWCDECKDWCEDRGCEGDCRDSTWTPPNCNTTTTTTTTETTTTETTTTTTETTTETSY
jgi:hypothetical protein